jgi:kynurenine formamidase
MLKKVFAHLAGNARPDMASGLARRVSNPVCRLLKAVGGFDCLALPPINSQRRGSRGQKAPDHDHLATNYLTRWKNLIKFKKVPGYRACKPFHEGNGFRSFPLYISGHAVRDPEPESLEVEVPCG